jgi:hypothetical protein
VSDAMKPLPDESERKDSRAVGRIQSTVCDSTSEPSPSPSLSLSPCESLLSILSYTAYFRAMGWGMCASTLVATLLMQVTAIAMSGTLTF